MVSSRSWRFIRFELFSKINSSEKSFTNSQANVHEDFLIFLIYVVLLIKTSFCEIWKSIIFCMALMWYNTLYYFKSRNDDAIHAIEERSYYFKQYKNHVGSNIIIWYCIWYIDCKYVSRTISGKNIHAEAVWTLQIEKYSKRCLA